MNSKHEKHVNVVGKTLINIGLGSNVQYMPLIFFVDMKLNHICICNIEKPGCVCQ